jgi:hypothetical protein
MGCHALTKMAELAFPFPLVLNDHDLLLHGFHAYSEGGTGIGHSFTDHWEIALLGTPVFWLVGTPL